MGYGLAMKYYLIVWGAFEECMSPNALSFMAEKLGQYPDILTSRS